jgi:hypothetical protein
MIPRHPKRECDACLLALPQRQLRCLERTSTITNTQPAGVQFSHPLAAQTKSDVPAGHMAHDNLFREPQPAAGQHEVEAAPRPTTGRRTAA